MKEIRLHGIGGLGTVKAGEMLVHAAVASGKFGNSIPFFGFERRAPRLPPMCAWAMKRSALKTRSIIPTARWCWIPACSFPPLFLRD